MPGILDIERGQLEFSANFRWRNVPVVSQLEQALPGYTFVMENDCKAVALAEPSPVREGRGSASTVQPMWGDWPPYRRM